MILSRSMFYQLKFVSFHFTQIVFTTDFLLGNSLRKYDFMHLIFILYRRIVLRAGVVYDPASIAL